MKVVGIIQARLGSTRLPKKVLREIGPGTSVIELLIARVSRARLIDQIIVATTHSNKDDALCTKLDQMCVNSFRGSEKDVLQRFFECARRAGADAIVRLTADDPFKDPMIIDRAIQIFCSKQYDYVSNTLQPTFPEGLDVEVFSFEALRKANKEAVKASDREHVTPYIWSNPDVFKVENFQLERNLQNWRWTIDYEEDIQYLARVFEEVGFDKHASYEELIRIVESTPSLLSVAESSVPRNEGFLKMRKKENRNGKC